MKKRTAIALFCAAAVTCSLTGCGQTAATETEADTAQTDTAETEAAAETETAAEDYSNQTLTGEITAIDGSVVTLALGELTEARMGGEMGGNMGGGQAPDGAAADGSAAGGPSDQPEKPSGDGTEAEGTAPADAGSGDTSTPPEKPSGDGTAAEGTAPADAGSGDTSTPPEKPSGDGTEAEGTAPADAGSGDTSTPPEKPSGDSTEAEGAAPADAGSGDTSAPPEMPEDDSSDTAAPADLPSGDGSQNGGTAPMTFTAGEETAQIDLGSAEVTKNGETVTVQELAVGDVLVIEVGDSSQVTSVTVQNIMDSAMGGEMGAMGGETASGEIDQGTSAVTISEDSSISDTTYTSSVDNENALRVDGATVTLDGIDVEKTAGASSNTENGDFYGVNAGLLATDGAVVTISNATVNTSVQNGNGVFSCGSGTTVNISNSVITTSGSSSGGLQTTGGGTTNASDLTVSTSGNSSAAIRSDRGGGTVNVDGGTYTTSGLNSPAVYSTADITVSSAVLTAENSEALVVEGNNSITLENCTVSGNMSDTEGTSSDENVHNVMIYQSMSGDAESGTSVFSMTGGSLTSENGDMFYITNTSCVLTLSGVELLNNDADGCLLRICGNSGSHGWGNAGSNGARVDFTADGQELSGNILVDMVSSLNMTLTGGSSFTGTVNITDNADGGSTDEDHAVVTVEEGSTWTLTGNCIITELENRGTINFNGYTITLADGTVLSE